MTTANEQNKTNPVSSLLASNENQSLSDQVKLLCLGRKFDDIGDVAVGMLFNVVVFKTTSKEEALRYLNLIFERMHKIVDGHYDEMVGNRETFKEQ